MGSLIRSRLGNLLRRVGSFRAYLAAHRKLMFLLIGGGAALAATPVFVLASGEAIEYIDSAAFCTGLCHDAHAAEATTFEFSPHSEVACASCHVGAGPENMVRSKLNGLKDIIPTITGNYSRPIETPLDSLRPSEETCEKCHWASKFSGDRPLVITTYAPDEANTRSTMALVIKVNGGLKQVASGVHWHATAKLWYVAVDGDREEMAWVGVEDASGNLSAQYVDPLRSKDLTADQVMQKKRLMDCVDCHNRITHLFKSPSELIDSYITDGTIDAKLPYIKQKGVAALEPQRATLEEAYAEVEKIRDFYATSLPEVYGDNLASVDAAIEALRKVASLTTFTDGLDWNTHTNNIGHPMPDDNMLFNWESLSNQDNLPGCFRCHGNLQKVDAPQDLGPDVLNNGRKAGQSFITSVNKVLKSGITQVNAETAGVIAPSASSPTPASRKANPTGKGSSAQTPAAGQDAPPPGFTPDPNSMNAECNLCHYTLKEGFISPLAPATSHPIDALDNCLVCHSPTGARPFKSTHPWATNDACRSCHQAAPKLKPIPMEGVRDAKPTSHSIANMEDCLICHGPTGSKAFKPEHPWATNETCQSCHTSAETLKPMPTSLAPEDAKPIPHPTENLGDCLVCHGPAGTQPFKEKHPWVTNDTCDSCHQKSASPKPLPTSRPPEEAKPIPHSTAGLDDCLVCHSPSGTKPFKQDHPWVTNDTCKSCHTPADIVKPLPSAARPANTPQITHPTTNTDDCLICHGPTGTRPFKFTHPWATNETCSTCHQPASQLKPLPVTRPANSPQIPHPTVNSEDCLACHGPAGAKAFKPTHPWATNETCRSCHDLASQLKPLPVTKPANAPQITHPTTSTDDCLACHGTTGTRPFKSTHPWSTNETCRSCHQPASTLKPLPTGSPTNVPQISHSVSNLDNCLVCHGPTGTKPFKSTHPWATNETCKSCHQTSPTPKPLPGSTKPDNAPQIPHATNNMNVCLVCHAPTASVPISNLHPWVTDDTCFSCHQQAANVSPLPSNRPAGVPQIPHSITNLTTCLACHGPAATVPVSTTHPWATDSTCLNCHQVSPSAVTIPTESLTPGPNISHSVVGLANCLACHAPAGSAPLPDNHVGRPTSLCLICHRQGTPQMPSGDPASLYSTSCAACHGSSRQGGSGPAVTSSALSSRTVATIVSSLTSGTMATYANGWSSTQISDMANWLKFGSTSTPTAPSGLSATAAGATQVNLFWQDNAANETGYRVERASSSSFTGTLTQFNLPAGTTGYSDTTTSGSTSYYYRVLATNAIGDSAASNTASVTTPASAIQTPAAPSNLTAAAAGPNEVTLTWQDNAANETSFRVERAANSSFTGTVTPFTLASGTTAYSDTTLVASTAYYYRVFASNGGGDSQPSNTASATTPGAAFDPAAAYAAGCASCHGAGRQGGVGPALTSSALSGVSLSTITASMTTGTMSPYTTGWTSANISAMTDWLKGGSPAVPVTPTGLSATAISAGQINLSWSDSNGSNETGVRLERAANGGFSGTITPVTLAAGATSYNDTTVAGSTTYYYRVFATSGAGDSPASNTASATTPAATTPPPTAPSNLAAAVVSATRINLTWLDNATSESGYRVERANNGEFTGTVTPVSLPSNSISYSDTTLAGASTYYYRVFAFNGAGDSASSNTASATTPAATFDPATAYSTNCAVCHGANRQGGIAPALTSSALSAVSHSAVTASMTTGTMAAYATGWTSSNISAMTDWLKGGPPAAPAAPINLTATAASASRINLTWADSNGANETGLRLERAANSSFSGTVTPVTLAAGATGYGDTTVSASTTYYYRIFAINGAGDSPASNTASATTPAATSPPPAAPANLTATAASPTQVNLAWTDNAANETGYRVERAANGAFTGTLTTFSLTANTTAYNDMTVSGSTTYYYRVFAFNTGGDSTASNTASATTPAAAFDPPTAYTANCAVCHGANRQGGVGPALTSSALSGVSLSTITASMTSGTMAPYATGWTSANISAMSNWLKGGSGSVPAAPTNLTATAAGTIQVNLFWTDNATNETGYRIERATNSNFNGGSTLVTLPAGTTGYSDMTILPSTTYYYRVFATNGVGDSPASNTASVTTPPPAISPPTAPGSLTATASSATQVGLAWLDNATTETGYRLERAANSSFSGTVVTFTLGANATSYNDTSVSGSVAYFYRVFATNSGGSSAASNTATVTTPAAVFDPATAYATNCAVCHGANRQGGIGPALTSSALSGVSLSAVTASMSSGTMAPYATGWTSANISAMANWLKGVSGSAPAAPTNLTASAAGTIQVNIFWTDNASNETGFRIERATNSSFTGGATLVTLPANVTGYSDMTISPSTTYYYRVFASNSSGDSAASNMASVTVPASSSSPPAAPGNLSATAVSAARVNLSWVDNATTEAGFRIERATNSGFSAGLTTFTVGAGVTSYADTSTTGSTTYYYRVFATNAAGPSSASNTTSVTTPA